MAKKNSKKSIEDIFDKINKTLEKSVDKKVLRPLAKFTIDLIVKRTRLGYGVDRQFGTKQKLKALSKPYIQFRQNFKSLSSLTTPGRSNLTLTGQMLKSMGIVSERGNSIFIGPSGNRYDTQRSNSEIADFQARQGRVFNRVSQLEYQQILRQYRRQFGDLLKKEKLIS